MAPSGARRSCDTEYEKVSSSWFELRKASSIAFSSVMSASIPTQNTTCPCSSRTGAPRYDIVW